MTPEPPPEPTNNAPTAAAGADQTVSATLPVMLDGSASTDSDGDPITYAWSFSATPAGSAAAFDDAASAAPSFTPDLPGSYTVQLVVNDGTVDSPTDQLDVTAEDNATTTTVDAAGGQAVSKDGSLTLDIPAGALATSEDIVITAVPANQYPSQLADLGPNDVVYDMKPDGLQFAQPVMVTLDPPDTWDAVVSGDTVVIPGGVLLTLSSDTFDLATDQGIRLNPATGRTEVVGEISHFSSLVTRQFYYQDENAILPFTINFGVHHQPTANVGEVFPVTWTALSGTSGVTATDFITGEVDDQSSGPAAPKLPFDHTFGPFALGNFEGLRRQNQYECQTAGNGTIDSEITYWSMYVHQGRIVNRALPLRVWLSSSIECKNFFASWVDAQLPLPERVQRVDPGPGPAGPVNTVVAHEGGATLLGPSGQTLADFSAAALNFTPVFGAGGNSDDGVVVFSSQGLHRYVGPLPAPPPPAALGAPARSSHPSYTLEAVPQPNPGPLMSAHATDLYHYGAPGSRWMAAVLYGDQNIAFFESGTDAGLAAGFFFDHTLATSFKPGGVSIFGATDIPVSVYVQPNGFTDADPILVITEDNTTAETKLWLVERTGSTVTATHVDTLFPYDAGRQVRCLDGICAITAFGSGLGFGATTMFSWDGGSAFSHIQTLVGRTIGMDLSHTASGDIQIATTSFNDNTFTVHLISAAGTYLNTAFVPVPQGCTGPGHIAFRQESEVIITCNTTGDVVSESFTYPVTN